ncbi:DeoR/GlpR family DNA-binding transcription regulator [Kushneria marisflavi]|uniref:DeoR family transcriptional regulator n=1 Tax=Kushneria marisflavi TaxID=157779 RepID=A0A240UN59_9GAMM|nr:DeoR/GlpR family DNA-binding transcription regulator [Kushneria marisflavi]ART62566.1 DeoR family transcriptional regulator [Kushneria marisflavi]RKD84058.1 DeoR family transcriptional regulator [Kushneria marisflavi]
MKVARRRQAMLDAVLSGLTDVDTLCAHFGVSEATVRRDLGALAEQGLIVRTYGGAAHVGLREPELTLAQRQSCHEDIKAQLAALALEQINDNDTLLLDGGTTTAALAAVLHQRHGLHVITNNLAALSALDRLPEGRVTILGGELRPSSMTTMGPAAQAMLTRLSVDRVFMSADGVTAELGLCEASPEQAWLKELMLQRSARCYVMADHTKLGRTSQQHWTPLPTGWTLITDACDEQVLTPFRQHHVCVLSLPSSPDHQG